MKEIVPYIWFDCSDENYWADADNKNYRSIVQIDGMLYTANDCPYGWNVLCRHKAKIMHIEL